MKRVVLVLLSWMGVNALFRRLNRGRIKILMYHNVTPKRAGFRNTVTPSEFEAQLAHLKAHYSVIGLTQEGAWTDLDPCRVNVLITFDDAFINNHTFAAPLLRKNGLTACFFLIATCAEEGAVPHFADRYAANTTDSLCYRTVTVAQAKEMLAMGMTIGSHSMDHRDFSSMPDNDALRDGIESRERLGDLLGVRVGLFAFPWGKFAPNQPEQLRTIFAKIMTTQRGFNLPSDWLLRRNEVADTYQMRAATSGSLDWLVEFVRRLDARAPMSLRSSRYSAKNNVDLYGR